MRPLFDPSQDSPPPDALELYFELPRSLGVLYTAAVHGHDDDLIQVITIGWRAGIAAAITALQTNAQIMEGQLRTSAELYITWIEHTQVDGVAGLVQPHTHLYLGAHGAGRDSQLWPVDFQGLAASGLPIVDAAYSRALRRGVSQQDPGVVWSAATADGEPHVVGTEQLVEDYPRRICAGPPRSSKAVKTGNQRDAEEAAVLRGEPLLPELRRAIRNQVDAQLSRERAQAGRRWIVRDMVRCSHHPPESD